MTEHSQFGWVLLLVGFTLAAMGLLWLFAPFFPWFGRLPGDIRIEGKSFRIYFPLVTCLLLSLALSLLMWVARLFRT